MHVPSAGKHRLAAEKGQCTGGKLGIKTRLTRNQVLFLEEDTIRRPVSHLSRPLPSAGPAIGRRASSQGVRVIQGWQSRWPLTPNQKKAYADHKPRDPGRKSSNSVLMGISSSFLH